MISSDVCTCSRCGERFNCIATFDLHKPGMCLEPATVGLVLNSSGYWIKPLTDRQLARLEREWHDLLARALRVLIAALEPVR